MNITTFLYSLATCLLIGAGVTRHTYKTSYGCLPRTISCMSKAEVQALEQASLATYHSNPHLAKLPRNSRLATVDSANNGNDKNLLFLLTDTIQTMSNRLATKLQVTEQPITIHIWNSSAIAMADCLPNKNYTALEWHIFVDPQELSQLTQAEQQFILGHELAHLYLHHPEQRLCTDVQPTTMHEHEYAADYVSAYVLGNAPGALSALTKWSYEEQNTLPATEEPDSHPSSRSRIAALHKTA